ncbi:hypothetical protein K435DRAFT_769054 [Dendrothele bispora CBS 962.96]|uniref:Uncharacterized protein n=1 Tax=Dendrothele bispora (strain CBS 962.96) TaxID=1314807 RepID=A0A4S8KST6_DENBC|nr:hypothetical protein K435DRAFT_769054 [Dendrothele bispora CBS 962.96]
MAKCSKCGTSNFHPRVSVNDNEILQRLRSSVGFTDQALTNQLLHDAEKDLDDYGTEIARLKTAISVLKRKREHLEGYVVKCRSLLSPIRRLPPEILSLIFLFRCRESGNNISLHQYNMTLPSIVLSQVCAGWRIVALDTSAIWSNLSFDFYQEPDLTCLNPSLLRSLIHLYLERSSQAPLDLSLFFIDHFDRDSDLGYAIFKTMLTPTSHRWRSLDLQYYYIEEDIEAIWSQITDLSGLEHLKIYGEPLELLLRHASAFHQVTPRLQCLDLKLRSSPLDLSGTPWAQITTLRLSSNFHQQDQFGHSRLSQSFEI